MKHEPTYNNAVEDDPNFISCLFYKHVCYLSQKFSSICPVFLELRCNFVNKVAALSV